MTEREIFEVLAGVKHPGQGDQDIVSLGLVEEVTVEGQKVTVTLAFPHRPDALKNSPISRRDGSGGEDHHPQSP